MYCFFYQGRSLVGCIGESGLFTHDMRRPQLFVSGSKYPAMLARFLLSPPSPIPEGSTYAFVHSQDYDPENLKFSEAAEFPFDTNIDPLFTTDF